MNGEQKQYMIVMHDKAAQMLYSHIRFVANVSDISARNLREKLYKAINTLTTMPSRCPVFHTNKTTENYYQLIISHYKIIFAIKEQQAIVNIRYILDTRQDNDL